MRTLWILLLSSMMLSCARVEASRQPVEVEMSNVDLHLASDVSLHVTHLRGRFDAIGARDVPLLDDKASYALSVTSGLVSIDMASLNALLARTLGDDQSNVDHLKVSVDDKGDLRQKGVIDKAVPIPFNARAGIEATPDGKLRVYTKSVKGFGLPMKSLMKVFHIETFGKLTMAATDLELVDMDPKDPFDFSVDHWNDQLVAGYSKTMTGGGLKAHIPDYNDLKKIQPAAPKR